MEGTIILNLIKRGEIMFKQYKTKALCFLSKAISKMIFLNISLAIVLLAMLVLTVLAAKA